ncbi:MAG: alpha/beta hydrolase [Deltaproteobacteria bacterium]|nr:alpha/beta hydrolase [Deltaproteobacteria bacterium]
MAETEITIPSGDILLEGRLDAAEGSQVAVLTHPHPLYGGNMDNNVVWTLKKAVRSLGWTTLRYNSRGVGRSGGSYGDGEGETQDFLAAVRRAVEDGKNTLHLAGYSYGAWIALKGVAAGVTPASLILVSPPLDLIAFQGLSLPSVPCCITLGTKDDFCRVVSLERWVGSQGVPQELLTVKTIPRCDHFYWGWESALAAIVEGFLKGMPEGVAD